MSLENSTDSDQNLSSLIRVFSLHFCLHRLEALLTCSDFKVITHFEDVRKLRKLQKNWNFGFS